MKRLVRASLLFCAASLLADPMTETKETPKPADFFFQKGASKWYFGGGVSFADLFYFRNTTTDTTTSNLFSANDSSLENTINAPSIGYNAFIGYAFNDYLDFELKGAQIIRPFKNSYNLTASGTDAGEVFNGSTKLYVITFGPYMLMNLPISKGFTPFFRFGMATDLVTFKDSAVEDARFSTDSIIDSWSGDEYFWIEKFNIGLGFKSTWWNVMAIKVEYETPTSTIISNGTTTNTGDSFYIPGILSASILFQF